MILSEDDKANIARHRDRYEAFKKAGQEEVYRSLPPPTSRDDVSDVPAIRVEERIPAGWYWTARLRRGETLRIVNEAGTASVSLLAWNSADPSERLNHADTIKVQWAATPAQTFFQSDSETFFDA